MKIGSLDHELAMNLIGSKKISRPTLMPRRLAKQLKSRVQMLAPDFTVYFENECTLFQLNTDAARVVHIDFSAGLPEGERP